MKITRMNSKHSSANSYPERDMPQCMPWTTNSFLLDKIVLNQLSTVDMGGKLHLITHLEIVVSKLDTIFTLAMHLTWRQTPGTRIILQLAHASQHGCITTNVCSVDSDVVLVGRCFDTFGLS
jgi:hypothetical protein